MNAETWTLGTNHDLDLLFETLRGNQYSNKSQPLWMNYNKEHFTNECSAVTIVFEHDKPILCASVLHRQCWPKNVYRIMNRLWRTVPADNPLRKPHLGVATMIRSQVNWLQNNKQCSLVFMSRQTDKWQKWSTKHLQKHYDLTFNYDNYKYLTCDNHLENSCWQRIIYQGDDTVLSSWSRKL